MLLRRQRQVSQMSAQRKSQMGSGDRSERIRTYNFPQVGVQSLLLACVHHLPTQMLWSVCFLKTCIF